MSDARVPRIPAALSAPSLNRGVGFTHAQRRRLGLTGRLPSAVLTLDQQAERVWHQLQSLATDLGRNLLLEQLHYRHEVLYFKVLADHLPELMPVVYTPTVGEAIQRFSDEYRGQRGLFLSIDEPDEIEEAFNTLGLGPEDVDLIVCTDAEAILGIGDWGVGGIQIAVGKLALYTAGGGVDPRRCLAVSLDVGTDNEQLLADPFYLGNRHARRRGREYDEFVSRYIETAQRLFPRAILHFEDFGPANARKILDTYGTDYCVFNDDMQGTGRGGLGRRIQRSEGYRYPAARSDNSRLRRRHRRDGDRRSDPGRDGGRRCHARAGGVPDLADRQAGPVVRRHG